MNFRKQRLTLDSVMEKIGVSFKDGCEPFIAYDPTVQPQYRIIRQQAHDGTLMFTQQLLTEALRPLLLRTSFYKPEPPAPGYVPRYTVGEIKLATVLGRVDLRHGARPGQKERITIPVCVEWVREGDDKGEAR